MVKFYSNSKTILQRVIGDIYNAFDWQSSDEGHDYWKHVVDNLDRYQRLAHKSSECKDEIEELKRRLAELEGRCCP